MPPTRWAAAAGAEQRDAGLLRHDLERERLRRQLAAAAAATAAPASWTARSGAARSGAARSARSASTSTACSPLAPPPAACAASCPGRVGDTPVIGAGTWADRDVAVSCTGQGEAFIRAGVGHQIASLVAARVDLHEAAAHALADVSAAGGSGGLIALDARGGATAPFSTEVMPRGIWRAGSEPEVAIGPPRRRDLILVCRRCHPLAERALALSFALRVEQPVRVAHMGQSAVDRLDGVLELVIAHRGRSPAGGRREIITIPMRKQGLCSSGTPKAIDVRAHVSAAERPTRGEGR